MTKDTRTNLVGFERPLRGLPAVLVPVWRDGANRLWASFRKGVALDRPPTELELVDVTDGQFPVQELPPDWSDASIVGLPPHKVGMFGLSSETVLAYPIEEEGLLLEAFLEDPSFCAHDPLRRLSLARATTQPGHIAGELLGGVLHFLARELQHGSDSARRRVEAWLGREREILRTFFGESTAFSDLLSSIPSSLGELSTASWWRDHVGPRRSGRPQSLAEIEDRQSTPTQIVVLGSQPKVPDDEVVRLMAVHAVRGARYRFLHSPDVDANELDALLAAVAQAVNRHQAPTAASRLEDKVAGGREKGSDIATKAIHFLKLEAGWTGSPYVFYFESGPGETTTIAGYRGLDVGSALSEQYVMIDPAFAEELLEALWSKAPISRDAVLSEDRPRRKLRHMREFGG